MSKPKFFQPKESEDKFWVVLITEVVRWMIIAICILLSIWRYAFFVGYTSFVSGTDCSYQNETAASFPVQSIVTSEGEQFVSSDCITQFWLISLGILLGASLVIYVPLKLFLASTILRDARYLYGWRPSILSYLVLCALPCIVLLLVGISSESGKARTNIDAETLTVIQVIVMGLTLTEWMAKIREETFTFDLVNAMSVDFFFAYDVFDFYDMFLDTEELYHSNWLYVNFVFAYIAMFKYLPQQPTVECCTTYYRRTAMCILVTMFCNDVPFVIMRIAIMVVYGTETSDFIHPLKNIALILFGLGQLYILHKNRAMLRQKKAPVYHERRCERNSSFLEDSTVPLPSRLPSSGKTDGTENEEDSFSLDPPEGLSAITNGVLLRNSRDPSVNA